MQDGLALQYAAGWCKEDKEVTLLAVEHNGLSLEYVAKDRLDRKAYEGSCAGGSSTKWISS